MQGEIGRRSGGDNVLEREGYAVAAGFSLGLVALGMIESAHALLWLISVSKYFSLKKLKVVFL